MLLTFRLFLGGASLIILALAVIARGLIPMPELRTRVGEVPSLGRSLIQEAMIPRAFIKVSDGPTGKRAEETKAVRELSHSDVALAPAAATIASPASEPASAAEFGAGSRPSGDLARSCFLKRNQSMPYPRSPARGRHKRLRGRLR